MYIKSYSNHSSDETLFLGFGLIKTYLASIQIDPKSHRLMKLADSIQWDEICEFVSEVYSSKKGRNSIPLRLMLGLEYYKHICGGLSDVLLIDELKTNIALKYFCGLEDMGTLISINPSSLTKFRNRITKHPKGKEIMDRIQSLHVQEMVRKLPKKVQAQYDQDGTVIEEKIAYPTDVNLLHTVVEKGAECLDIAKKALGRIYKYICCKGRKGAKEMYLNYQFAGQKRKELAEATKKTLISVANNTMKVIQRLGKKLEQKIAECKEKGDEIKETLKQAFETVTYHCFVGAEILEQQTQMIVKGVKHCVDRVVSYARSYVRPIVKGKLGKKVQFGAKVGVGVIGGKVAVAVSHTRDNRHETNDAIEGLDMYKKCMGKDPNELGYDKGGRGEFLAKELEARGIKNYVQGTKTRKSLPEGTRKRLYNRRAFSENIINDIKNHRGVNKNLHSKNNAFWSFMVGTMSSNIVRLRYL